MTRQTENRSTAMQHTRKNRGEGKMGAIIALIVIVAGVYVAFKIIPVMVATYDFEQQIETITRRSMGMGSPNTEEGLMNAVMKEARRLNLPVTEKDVKIVFQDKTTSIEVRYTVTVDLPGYTWRSEQNPKSTSTLY